MRSASGRREVVLHIGTHKTGTTAFQRYCLENRAWLAGQGVDLFVHASGAPQAHELPLLALRDDLTIPLRVRNPDWTLDEAKGEMRRTVADALGQDGGARLLFSHEALSFARTDAEIDTLRALLGAVVVRVVVMLRRPDDYLASWKKQLERMGFSSTSSYRTSFQYTEPDSWLVDFERLLAVYRDGFGADQVTVLDYDAAVEADASVVPVLLETCGVDRSSLAEGWQTQRNRRDEPSGF